MMKRIKIFLTLLVVFNVMNMVSIAYPQPKIPKENIPSDIPEDVSMCIVENNIVTYLGYKSGKSGIVKISGKDLKGAAKLPPGVSLAPGTESWNTYGPIEIVAKEGVGAIIVAVEDGTTVEYADGLTIIKKKEVWYNKATGKKHSDFCFGKEILLK